ncbi:hypothetical protein LCGC14_0246100 [marine sediment metagenome]|uniref:Uncharacterized protein n=1 Tax=marine sediment metagenome TaxID=412755 RepID=A0A0F9UAN2_9ZZZZ
MTEIATQPKPTAKPARFRSLLIDTISQLQDDQYLAELAAAKSKKLEYDEWRNHGVSILTLYKTIKSLSDTTVIQVLGYEGTGKSMGGYYLDPTETFWLNIDKKPLPWAGWKKTYGDKHKNYAVSSSYSEVEEFITEAHSRAKKPFVVFILGHLEDFTSVRGEKRQQLRVIGKMAHKHNIEGALVHNYYTRIDETKDALDPERYLLSTQNSGLNTARSPFLLWDKMHIPTNFQNIVDAVVKDWNEI